MPRVAARISKRLQL